MIKAVILDDEYLVIEAMKALVNWKKYNIEIVGTAMDGQSGFDLIVEKQPHIVLTDIRMPEMDGLSIIEKVKYIYPEMQFILFSGYTDFSYAKKAIVLGVLDYIVKPITAEKVETALVKALNHIDDPDNLILRAEVQETLLQGAAVPEEDWRRTEAPMAVSDIRECLILACSLPEENIKIREYLYGSKNLKKYGVFYSVYPAMQAVMCLSSGVNGKEKMLEALKMVVDIWKKERSACHIGAAYGRVCQLEIRKVFDQAAEAMNYAVFTGETQIVDYQKLVMQRRIPTDIQKYESRFLKDIEENQTEDIKKAVKQFEEECLNFCTEPRITKHFILEFVYNALSLKKRLIAERADYRFGMQMDDEYECPPHVFVDSCSSYQELIAWFRDEMLRIAREVAENQGGGQTRRQIQLVKDYIHTCYQKDITLFELAEISKMTPAYFSNVFKQEVGISYIKYLTRVRIERAKELLMEGYKVADVSQQVGYENYRYFCVIFKKYTGMTAQQFKGISKEAP